MMSSRDGRSSSLWRLDWSGQEVEKIADIPPVDNREIRSPDGHLQVLFLAGPRDVTVITRDYAKEVARVTFPVSLLHPPKRFETSEPFSVAVDNAGRVMIACPNAPEVSLVAVQGWKVIASGRVTTALPLPAPNESFSIWLSGDGSALLAQVTDLGKAPHEYRSIRLTGSQITTRVEQTGQRDIGFEPVGVGDYMIEREYTNEDGWTIGAILSGLNRTVPAYAGMHRLDRRVVIGGWVALQGKRDAPVYIQNVVSGDSWHFHSNAPVREVLLTPDGRYALSVELFKDIPSENLLKQGWTHIPHTNKPLLRPDVRLAIYERPGRLRAFGYSQYQQSPPPAARWAYGTDYFLSPDGRKVIEVCERDGTSVFSW